VTLTLKRLLQTRSLYLHIEGEDKEKVLEKALEQGPVEEMPVRAVLRQTQKPVIVFWCP
jgi:6-phosphogluconolactonase